MTAGDVVNWMVDQIPLGGGWLRQRRIARHIRDSFGPEFVYKNDNGNPAISAEILEGFRQKTESDLVWSRSRQAWRLRKPTDGEARMVR